MANYEGGSVELQIKSTADQAAQALNRLMAAVRSVRGEIASFDKQFDNVSKSVNRLANGMKILEKLNFNKVNVQVDQVTKALGNMSANLAKVDLSGFNVQSDNAAQALNRLTNSFRQLERLKNIDTRRAYTDLDRLGRVSSAGIEKMADALQSVELGKIQGAGAAINQLTNSLFKLQGLKLAPDITGNLRSQLDILAPTLTDFMNRLSGIRADGLKEVINALRDIPKAMERMQSLDLSRIGEVFSNLTQQILPFLAHLKEASAELQAFATISKNLGGHGGAANLNLPTTKGIGGVNILSRIFTGVREGISNFISGIGRMVTGLKNLRNHADRTNKSFLGMLNVGRLYFLFNYFKRMGQAFANMLTQAIDFIEVENLFSRAMGTARDEAFRFANTMSEAFGLALPDLMKAQAIFNNILTNLGGINEEMGQILSQSLTKMAVDFSALYNISVEDAITKIEAALVGQTKPIRSVSGMDITAATLQTYLTQLGIVDRTVRQLSEVEKRLLRIYAIQEQLRASGAMGAWAQEIENPANQLKILQQQLQEVGRWISAVFLNTIARVLPYINGFVIAIKELVKSLAFFVGYELPITEDIPDLLDTDGAVDGLEDVNDALKDIKNTSIGIDELNVLAPPEAATTPTGIDPRLLEALKEYDNLMDGIRMKAMDIRDAILDWLNFIRSLSWEELADYARGLGEQLANYLNNIIAGINWYEIGENIAHGLNTALNFLYGFMTTFDFGAVGKALADGLNGIIDTVDWDLLGRTLASYWNAVIDFLYGFIVNFQWAKFGIAIGTAIMGFFDEINWAKAGETLGLGISGVFATIGNVISTIDWRKIGKDVADFLNNAIQNIDWRNIGRTLSNLMIGILNFLSTAIQEFDWNKLMQSILEFITGINWSGILSAIVELIGTLLGSLMEFLWGSLRGAFDNAVTYFTDMAKEFGDNIVAGIFFGIIFALVNIATWIYDNIFKPFVDGFKKAFGISSPSKEMYKLGVFIIQGLLDGIKSLIDKAVTYFRDLWKNIQDVFKDVKKWFSDKFAEAYKAIQDAFKDAKKFFDETWKKIQDAFKDIKSWFSTKFNEAWTAIQRVFDPVVSFFRNVYSNITSAFSGIQSWFSNTFAAAWNAVQRVFDPVTSFFTNIKDRIVSVFSNMGSAVGNAISSTLRSTINSVLSWVQSAINGAISSVNSLLSRVNSAIGTSISKIQSVSIPKFENSGFPDKGVFAFNEGSSVELLGNINGRTAVLNQSDIVASVSQGVAQAVASVLSTQQQRPRQPIEVTSVLQVGARELARATNQAIADMGTNQLEGVFANA